MKRSVWQGALASIAVHLALFLAFVWVGPTWNAEPVDSRPARNTGRGASVATRVALLGRATQVRAEAAASEAAAPVVLRHRGPVRQPQADATEAPEGEAELGGVAGGTSASEPGEGTTLQGGDGLAGVLANSADALAGDPAAPARAESLTRQALAPAAPDLSKFSARLQVAAARCYPDSARRFRQTGVATVAFCLDATGALRSASVSRSSGSGALDEAATGCVLPGALPAGPEVGAGCFTLPVRFGGAR